MKRYLLLFAIVFFVVVSTFIPLHNLRAEDMKLLSKFPESEGKIILFGNSINLAVSKCDKNLSGIPDMFKRESTLPLVNLSKPGMTIGEMMNTAELGVSAGVRPDTIIFPLSAASNFFKTTTKLYTHTDFLKDNINKVTPSASATLPAQKEVTDFNGKHYGSYGDFSKTYFVIEKRDSTCPETMGVDKEFIQFMYWRNFLQPSTPLEGAADFVSHAQDLQKKNIRIVFWFAPIDYDDIQTLHGEAGIRSVKDKVKEVKNFLSSHNFPIIDSSESLKATDFTDRWCACGHMSESGRKIAAKSLANGLEEVIKKGKH